MGSLRLNVSARSGWKTAWTLSAPIGETAYIIILSMAFRVLRQTHSSDSASASPLIWGPLSSVNWSSVASGSRGSYTTISPGGMLPSPSDDLATGPELEHGYAVETISTVEAARTGALCVLLIEDAPARLVAWLSDR